ncbi:QRFP-like peptide receptor [Exaiptasia diaphana]|uniref:G-protein coupled receptors family 1 profile domain-containing protein n=1 Tax=Exaiptasia diaphana TaxID=2652724 RepID=A0A913X4Y9_EXADI|nr:QRFP-like peptide receptor [Exaiptasia diaphana]
MNSTTNIFHAITKTQQKYVFRRSNFKTVAYSLLCVLGLYALVANGVVLYLKRTQRKNTKAKGSLIAFSRFHVISSYVESLSVSHFLCACLVIPLVVMQQFFDLIDTDFKCKLIRCIYYFFPLVTTNNLFVIGIERYIAVFHPQKVPSSRILRCTIACAWILAAPVSIILSAMYNLIRVDIDEETYTMKCLYDKASLAKKVVFLVLAVCYYIIPSVLLSVLNIKIARYLSRLQTKSVGKKNWIFHGVSTFVVLIFCFIIPFMVFFVSSVINIYQIPNLKFDIPIGHIGLIAVYANSAISPTVLLLNMKDLRVMLKDLLGCMRNNPGNKTQDVDMQERPNKKYGVNSDTDIEESVRGERHQIGISAI